MLVPRAAERNRQRYRAMIRRTLSDTKAATFCVQLPNTVRQCMPTPTGTGFFISPDGWFLTAAHVVTEDGTPSGKIRRDVDKAWLMKETRIAGGSPGAMCQHVSFGHVLPAYDVALLKVDFDRNVNKDWLKGKSEFPCLIVSSRDLEEGEPVYAFGYPLSSASRKSIPGGTLGVVALNPRVTSAIVSSTFERSKLVITDADAKVYVLDKALNYGNSGGPIVATETGHAHAVCSRFQSLPIPQKHLRDANKNPLTIHVPSLYGVVSSLANPPVLDLLDSIGASVKDA